LPALAYAKQRLEQDDDWVVLIDDDSIVRIHKLIAALAMLPNPRKVAYYAGDFVTRTGVHAAPAKDGWGAFACGGSGSVFSRAAMERMDFGACARRWQTRCFQSDWMIGRCAAEAGVSRVDGMMGRVSNVTLNVSLSCGACSLKCKDATATKAVLQRLRAGCAFAQVVFSGGCSKKPKGETRTLLRAVCHEASLAAVSHLNGCAELEQQS